MFYTHMHPFITRQADSTLLGYSLSLKDETAEISPSSFFLPPSIFFSFEKTSDALRISYTPLPLYTAPNPLPRSLFFFCLCGFFLSFLFIISFSLLNQFSLFLSLLFFCMPIQSLSLSLSLSVCLSLSLFLSFSLSLSLYFSLSTPPLPAITLHSYNCPAVFNFSANLSNHLNVSRAART